ncbi:hypothetical protein [Nesterenkonia jeotgali]|uniref:Uncharacterized protein n=1 Tax=Nesterenkonia jeotgali TaxID=317018 RepID=A0A0W8IGX4_9MICC|nr:hypothetical protein [Nesterenkonia jeotgali]KUG58992.1 hypothetical protein AVL63_02925 [Nesterenkonia jeotgali]
MSPELITALVSLVGGGIGVKIIDWTIAWTKGRMDQAQKVQKRLDAEVQRRQGAEQALHIHRVRLIQAGVPERDLPDMPANE